MKASLRKQTSKHIATAIALALAFSAAGGPRGPKNAPEESPIDPEAPVGRSALRQTVQKQCVINWVQHQRPAPCERVYLSDPNSNLSGYALLADRGGGAHYLLVPTQTMAGIDSSELLDPDAPNYFAQAWHARDLIATFVGHDVPRNSIGLAMGILQFRTQDQFHIHLECLRLDVSKSLRVAAEDIKDVWSPLTVVGSTYQAMRVQADSLDGINVFELLATLKPDVRHHMSDYTLVVAGAQFKSGPGFVLLTGTGPSGELLLDSTCESAGGGG